MAITFDIRDVAPLENRSNIRKLLLFRIYGTAKHALEKLVNMKSKVINSETQKKTRNKIDTCAQGSLTKGILDIENAQIDTI